MRWIAWLSLMCSSGCAVTVSLDGKRCDDQHGCEQGWFCLDGLCAREGTEVPGTEGAPCFANGTCVGELACLSDRCVQLSGSDAGPRDGGATADAGPVDGGGPPDDDAGPLDDDAGPLDDGGGALDDDGGPLDDDGGPPDDDGGPLDDDGGPPDDDAGPVDAGPCVSPASALLAWTLDAPAGGTAGALGGVRDLYWPFDSSFLDESGNGYHLSAGTGASLVPGKLGRAVALDGSTSMAPLAPSNEVELRQQLFDLSLWLRFDATAGLAYDVVTGPPSPTAGVPAWQLVIAPDGTLRARLHLSDGAVAELVAGSVVGGEWHHVLLSVAATGAMRAELLVDGDEEDAVALSAALLYDEGAQVVLAGGGSAQPLIGALDDVALFDEPLTQDERDQLVEGGHLHDARGSGRDAEVLGALSLASAVRGDGLTLVEGGSVAGWTSSWPSSTALTLSFWFRLPSLFTAASTSGALVTLVEDGESHLQVAMAGADYATSGVPDGVLVFKVKEGGNGEYRWTTRTSWDAGGWIHVAAVRDPSTEPTVRIYIDGVQDQAAGTAGAGDASFDLSRYSGPLVLGALTGEAPGGNLLLAGLPASLDEVLLFSRVLTPAEIAVLAGEGGLCAQ